MVVAVVRRLRAAQRQLHDVVRRAFLKSHDGWSSDEVILNQPRGALRVRILEPERGVAVAGRIVSKAEIVVDALAEFGVRHVEMPTTPEKIWQAIRDAKAATAGQVS